MHERGERRFQRASTMSFNSASEAEKLMSVKRSFFSKRVRKRVRKRTVGGVDPLVQVNIPTVLN